MTHCGAGRPFRCEFVCRKRWRSRSVTFAGVGLEESIRGVLQARPLYL
jgi:hypothetical protein